MPPGAVAPSAESGETLEFAGVNTIGKKTDLRIYDKSTKKSRWIPLGETIDGITALKYDSRLEQAVVRANGVEKVLSMRKGTGPVNAPSVMPPMGTPTVVPLPAPAPPAVPSQPVASMPAPAAPPTPAPPIPGAPQTPETVARQETEARMLVSDLLEIGMAQRKAYEEAQRKAAAGEPGPVSPAPPPPPGAAPEPPAQQPPVQPPPN